MVTSVHDEAFCLDNFFKIKFWGESKVKFHSAGNAVSYSSGAICGHVSQGMEGTNTERTRNKEGRGF